MMRGTTALALVGRRHRPRARGGAASAAAAGARRCRAGVAPTTVPTATAARPLPLPSSSIGRWRGHRCAPSSAPLRERRSLSSAPGAASTIGDDGEAASIDEAPKDAAVTEGGDPNQAEPDDEPNAVDYGSAAFPKEYLYHNIDPRGLDSTTRRRSYGRMIDCARLAAETAYDRNEAVVGALAEAGGDEGAAERWLMGFLALLGHGAPDGGDERGDASKASLDADGKEEQGKDADASSDEEEEGYYYLPDWWKDDPARYEAELLELARDRSGRHFVMRCVDKQALKEQMGTAEYDGLDLIAYQWCQLIVDSFAPPGEEDGQKPEEGDEDVKSPQEKHFPREAIDRAKEIWGREMVKELSKKTAEERNMEQMEQGGFVKKVQGEAKWWGSATKDDPTEAYEKLLDAARLGTLQAYDHGEYVGAIADALAESDHYNFDEPPDAHDHDHAHDRAHDDEEEKMPEPIDLPRPTEIGPNARKHFAEFLGQLKGYDKDDVKLMPEWWDEDVHEKEMWAMAEDVHGAHCLAYPMDKDELKEAYPDDAARHSVGVLSQAAAEVGVIRGLGPIPEDGAGASDALDDVFDDADAKHLPEGEEGDDDGERNEAESEVKEEWDYEKMTVASLKILLRERGLKVSGRKAELVDRLRSA